MITHVSMIMMEQKSNILPKKYLAVGDILEDTAGNKMVVVDVLAGSAECYVLFNGRIRLVNPQGSSIIKSHKSSSN